MYTVTLGRARPNEWQRATGRCTTSDAPHPRLRGASSRGHCVGSVVLRVRIYLGEFTRLKPGAERDCSAPCLLFHQSFTPEQQPLRSRAISVRAPPVRVRRPCAVGLPTRLRSPVLTAADSLTTPSTLRECKTGTPVQVRVSIFDIELSPTSGQFFRSEVRPRKRSIENNYREKNGNISVAREKCSQKKYRKRPAIYFGWCPCSKRLTACGRPRQT